MNSTVLNLLIVLALILIEGLFVATEIALVSLREGQARAMAENGRRGQSVARLLADAMDVPEIHPEVLGKARAGDIRNCFADISRARELLGFSPRFRLENTLVEMAEWVRGVTAIDRSDEMRRQLEARGLVT